MARAATTTDAFNAVGDVRRREILDLLAQGECSVNELVARLDVAQPVVSKHLRVLREVGLVEVRDEGRQRIYRLDAEPLRAVYDWVKDFERLWTTRFALMDTVLDELKAAGRETDDLSTAELKAAEAADEEEGQDRSPKERQP
jgi:DNA-binding transcriptional ArsR family regulator